MEQVKRDKFFAYFWLTMSVLLWAAVSDAWGTRSIFLRDLLTDGINIFTGT